VRDRWRCADHRRWVPTVRAGRLPRDLRFDGVKCGDAGEEIGRERGRLGLVLIEDLAPEMRPAGDLEYIATLVELPIACIGVGLQEPLEGLQLGLRMGA
jgi:hypothetical protein